MKYLTIEREVKAYKTLEEAVADCAVSVTHEDYQIIHRATDDIVINELIFCKDDIIQILSMGVGANVSQIITIMSDKEYKILNKLREDYGKR